MMSHRFYDSALAVFCSFALASTCVSAAEVAKSEIKPHWVALIQSRSYPGWSKENLEKDGTPEAYLTRNLAQDSKWDTFFADDKTQGDLPGLFVASEHIFELKKRKVTRTKKNSVGWKISGEVIELDGRQLGTQTFKRVLGAKGWKDFEDYCQEQSDTKGDKDCKNGVVFECSRDYSILSIFGPYISVCDETSTYACGSPHPYGDVGWSAYKLTATGMKDAKISYPPSVKAKIHAGCKKLFDDYPDGDIYDSTQTALSPSGGGAMTETYFNPVRPEQGVVLVKLPQAIPASYEKTKNDFVSKNKSLIDWSKSKVFTVAPDQCAVAYVLGNKLYWRSVSANQPRLIGTVTDVRGWQWTDANKLTDAERQKLGLVAGTPAASH
jgi:hypothetical protein